MTEGNTFSRTKNPALILIDIQKGFEDLTYWGGQRNNENAEEKAGELLQLWRKHELPIFHVKHCSSNPKSLLREGQWGNDFNEFVKPLEAEPIIKKDVNSAFIGTDLQEKLNQAGITQLVIVGLTTDHCVSTTTRMAGNLGFDTFLVHDATATFNKKSLNGENYSAEIIHETAIASLQDEFATIIDTEFIKKYL